MVDYDAFEDGFHDAPCPVCGYIDCVCGDDDEEVINEPVDDSLWDYDEEFEDRYADFEDDEPRNMRRSDD